VKGELKMVLAIYGAGGLGIEVYDLARRNNEGRWSEIVFVDDHNEAQPFRGTQKMPLQEVLNRYPVEEVEGVVAVGEPSTREVLYNKMKQRGVKIATLIEKTTLVSDSAQIEEGTIVFEFTTIRPNVRIGKNVLIHPYCNIGHDIQIGDHVVMCSYSAPGGACQFGDRAYIALHACIREKLVVGHDAIVGMGAVVLKDVEPNTTVAGIPAKVIQGNPNHKVFR